MSWPQWIIVGWWLFLVILQIGGANPDKSASANIGITLRYITWATLLWVGGFFNA